MNYALTAIAAHARTAVTTDMFWGTITDAERCMFGTSYVFWFFWGSVVLCGFAAYVRYLIRTGAQTRDAFAL